MKIVLAPDSFKGSLTAIRAAEAMAAGIKEISASADLVITGEGKSDLQTLAGKASIGVSRALSHPNIPVFLISGEVAEESLLALKPFFTEIH